MQHLGQPGQRETKVSGLESEVTIVLQQWKWATIAALLIAFVLHFVLLKLEFQFVARWPLLPVVQHWQGVMLLCVALVLPAKAALWTLVANLYDANWPPPAMVQSRDLGPLTPRNIRRAAQQTTTPPQQIEATRQQSVPEVAPPITNLEVFIRNGNNTKRARIDGLSIADWQRLSAMARRGVSFSVEQLRSAGFKQPRDREVNKLLWDAGVLEKDGKRTLPLAEFRQYLTAEQYK